MTSQLAASFGITVRPVASTALRSLGLVAVATVLIQIVLPVLLGAAAR